MTDFLKGFSWFNGADPSPPASSATLFTAGDGREEEEEEEDIVGVGVGVGVRCQTRMAATSPAVQRAVMTAVRKILSQPG